VIELSGISRTYYLGGRPVHALADVSEHIRAGEHVAIMGPSGSGKSTLLNLLGCLDRPDAGSYRLNGREVARLDDRELTAVRRDLIGFVFQFFHLVPRLTAAENVELPMLFAGLPRAERRARVETALGAVDLTGRSDHRPDELSGGERQRVALARATVMRPRLLLADEPTGNLDTASGRQILDLLGRLNAGGMTLVVVTHDPLVARRAQRVLVLVDGRIARRLAAAEAASADDLFAPAATAGDGLAGDAAAEDDATEDAAAGNVATGNAAAAPAAGASAPPGGRR
jgi:putative ABC transport system ATP-binding protein